ncbi:isoamylase early set domain-containing protein [Streptomyces sp. LARHCF249]
MLERKRRKGGNANGHTEITFVLPADAPPGPVSVVGDFNDWRPGVHELRPRKDGTRAVTVALPGKTTHAFRYLAAGDHWFNDEGADALDGSNSLLHT